MTPGHQNIKAESEEEVMQWMQERSMCRVVQVVFPYTGHKDYYISEHGHFFSVLHQRYRQKRWCADMLSAREENYGYSYSIQQNGKQVQCKAEKLIYCSFVTGEWSEDIEIDFKDGDPKNIHLDNLAECGEYLTEEAATRMARWASVYQKYFNRVMKYIAFFADIDTEDAEDLTSKAFIYLCAKEREITRDFVSLWIYYAKKKAQSFWLWRCEPRIGRADEIEWLLVHNTPPIGLDILDVLPDERWKIALRDMAEGCSQEFTAQKLGLSVSSVRDFRRQAKSYMRKYLSTDRELMKIYG